MDKHISKNLLRVQERLAGTNEKLGSSVNAVTAQFSAKIRAQQAVATKAEEKEQACMRSNRELTYQLEKNTNVQVSLDEKNKEVDDLKEILQEQSDELLSLGQQVMQGKRKLEEVIQMNVAREQEQEVLLENLKGAVTLQENELDQITKDMPGYYQSKDLQGEINLTRKKKRPEYESVQDILQDTKTNETTLDKINDLGFQQFKSVAAVLSKYRDELQRKRDKEKRGKARVALTRWRQKTAAREEAGAED